DYTWKDAVLYALGVGAKTQELDYLYEGRGPRVLPTFAVVPKFGPMLDLLATTGGNMAMIVDRSQRVVVHAPFASAGRLVTTAVVREVADLRRLAVLRVDTRTEDE